MAQSPCLALDPIARFGVGLLSCFMVADRVEIATYRDPYLPPTSQPLKITIPAVRKHFRIEPMHAIPATPGTVVTVFVRGHKRRLLQCEETSDKDSTSAPPMPSLLVTEYLRKVAGFVEFPIMVKESGRSTVILHPKQDAEEARARFGSDSSIAQLPLGFPVDDAILPQDVDEAGVIFEHVQIDLRADLTLDDFEGTVSYLRAKQGLDYWGSSSTGLHWIDFDGVTRSARWHEKGWRYASGADTEALSRSVSHEPSCAVYRDGILVAGASLSRFIGYNGFEAYRPASSWRVNISKAASPQLDLARAVFRANVRPWATSVIESLQRFFLEKHRARLLDLPILERLVELTRLVAFDWINPDALCEAIGFEAWPVITIGPNADACVNTARLVFANFVPELPENLENDVDVVVKPDLVQPESLSTSLTRWSSDAPAVYTSSDHFGVSDLLARISNSALRRWCRIDRVRFVEPERLGDGPMTQYIWRFQEDSKELKTNWTQALSKVLDGDALLDDNAVSALQRKRDYSFQMDLAFARFAPPFQNCFGFGCNCFNVDHPVTVQLLRLEARRLHAEKDGSLKGAQAGRLNDAIKALSDVNLGDGYDRWVETLLALWGAARDACLGDFSADCVPGPDEFVPRSWDKPRTAKRGKRNPNFGRPVTG